MPAIPSHPGVYIEEVSSGVSTITGIPTSIALFVGWAARGPVDRARRLTSFADFECAYGGLDARAILGYSVKHFFDNGGADLYVLRLVHTDAEIAKVVVGDLTFEASSPGAWANDYRLRFTERSDEPTRFKLEVLSHPTDDTAVVEVFENLSMRSGDPRFIASVINGRSVAVTTQATGPTMPATGTVAHLDNTHAGVDGTVLEPADSGFHTALLANFGKGSVIDRLDLFNLVCVPGLTHTATITALQTHCKERRAFLIVDSVEGETVANMETSGLVGLTGPDAHNAALYYPWVRAPDPLKQGALRNFPPSGFVAGIYARIDTTRGVWKAPAGSDASIRGASALAVGLSDSENDQLNPRGINCLRAFPGHNTVVMGGAHVARKQRSRIGVAVRSGQANGVVS